MTDDDETPVGYGSAMDLPSFAALRQQVAALAEIKWLLPKEQRAELDQHKKTLATMAQDVDRFYTLLGARQWIFHDLLPTSTVHETIVASETFEDAEAALIRIYEDPERLAFMVRMLMQLPDMRVREHLLRQAMMDMAEGRYSAVVLSLLTVMDGFVNDVEKVHRGLHAREASELDAWDTPVGHHMGLSATQRSFRKSYSVRVEDECFVLARNGILHGNIINFNNVVVAAKAWNRLFAVADWVRSLERKAEPEAPEPTWTEILGRLKSNSEMRTRMDAWTATPATAVDPDDLTHPVLLSAQTFLTLWQRTNWGHLSNLFMNVGKGEGGKCKPKEAKEAFAPYVLEDFNLVSFTVSAPAIAEVEATVTVAGEPFPVTLRMTYTDEEGGTLVEGDGEGIWRMVWRNPDMFNRDMWRVANYPE